MAVLRCTPAVRAHPDSTEWLALIDSVSLPRLVVGNCVERVEAALVRSELFARAAARWPALEHAWQRALDFSLTHTGTIAQLPVDRDFMLRYAPELVRQFG